jgi:hypothetical protein
MTVTKTTIIWISVAVYVFIGLLTFGSYAATNQRWTDTCLQQYPMLRNSTFECSNDPVTMNLAPLLSGALWFVYWPLHLAKVAYS